MKSTREMRDTNKALEDRLSLSKTEISNLQHSLEAIRAESLTDPLTGLGNRKYFDRSIEVAVQAALASGEPLSLLMFDIDHFKSFNDSYGHLTGDQVLRLVGMSLKQTIKGQDITARYGGEEFAVVLPNTALRQALTVADHIRRAVMAKELKKKSTGEILGRVTISVGVSMLKPGDDTDSLIERADACLYAAKRNGRNRVICEVDPEYAAEYAASEPGAPDAAASSASPFFLAIGFFGRRLSWTRPSSCRLLSRPCVAFGRLLQRRALGGRQRRPRPYAQVPPDRRTAAPATASTNSRSRSWRGSGTETASSLPPRTAGSSPRRRGNTVRRAAPARNWCRRRKCRKPENIRRMVTGPKSANRSIRKSRSMCCSRLHAASRRTPGPIRRVISCRQNGRHRPSIATAVAMGRGVRRDDGG